MKTLKQITENQDFLDEKLNLRSVSGVVMVGKIQQTTKTINSITLVDPSTGQIDPKKLEKKINLLSTQNLYLSVLVGSLSLMKKR
jgi:hypothetical protein